MTAPLPPFATDRSFSRRASYPPLVSTGRIKALEGAGGTVPTAPARRLNLFFSFFFQNLITYNLENMDYGL
jgi:hypothetical protein